MTSHLHYHQLYDSEVHHMNRPLGNYWKGLLAQAGVVALAFQSWIGDVGNSHISTGDWVKLAIAEITALAVYAKANTGSTGPNGV